MEPRTDKRKTRPTTSRRGRVRVTGTATATLAITPGADGALPTEFRLFVAGVNETMKGSFLFDEAAAAEVMATYGERAIDLAIDLEHQMLDAEPSPDPTAKDARGWCNLELRADGSLWAVNVSWTPDGAARLTDRRQRYVSPAFAFDKQTSRVTSILNIAITAIPATHGTPALVAASARDLRKLSAGTSFDAVRMALTAALQARFPVDDSTGCVGGVWVADVYDATVVYELDGKLFEVSYTFADGVATLGASATEVERAYKPVAAAAPAAPAPATLAARKKFVAKLAAGGSMDPKLITEALDALVAGDSEKCMELLKGLIATAAGGEAAPGDKPEPDPALAAAGDKPEEVAAALSVVTSLSGKASLVGSVADIRTWHASHVALATERKAMADREKVLESAERRKLCVELVTLGGRQPATVWAKPDSQEPKPYLAEMPIASLRAMHADAVAALGGRPAQVKPPAGGGDITAADGSKDFDVAGTIVTLSALELSECARAGAKPEVFAANKAQRLQRRGGK